MDNSDEILVKDLDGTFKVLKDGKFQDIADFTVSKAAPAPVAWKEEARPPSPMTQAVGGQAQEIILKAGFSWPKELEERAKSVIISRLKDVRDDLETKEALIKPLERGGLGISETEALKLLQIIKGKLPVSLDKKAAPVFILPPSRMSRDKVGEFIGPTPKPPLPAKPKPVSLPAISPKPIVPAQLPQQPLKPLVSLSQPLKTSVSKPKPLSSKTVPPPKKLPVETFETSPPATGLPRRAGQGSGQIPTTKVRVMDVRPPLRLITPSQELKMSLNDFRRMAPTPEEAARIIFDKIEFLGQESFEHKLEAIKSWKEGEVYRLYGSIIEESVAQGKSFEKIILEREQTGKSMLTPQEFSAVLELSKRLRF